MLLGKRESRPFLTGFSSGSQVVTGETDIPSRGPQVSSFIIVDYHEQDPDIEYRRGDVVCRLDVGDAWIQRSGRITGFFAMAHRSSEGNYVEPPASGLA